jgi:tRNA A-37 threonylcarbamoyl transferase component Bud32
VNDSDDLRVRVEPRGLLSLFPRFDEPISPEFYRWSGKLRIFAIIALAVGNLPTGLTLDRLGLDPGVFWRVQIVIIGLGAVDCVLAAIVWKRHMSVEAMAALTRVSIVLEVIVTLVALWAFGSVNSHMVVFAMLVVLIYRVAFDFRIGAFAFVTMLAGHWAVVVSEANGWIPSRPLLLEADLSMSADRMYAAMSLITFMLVLTFVIANWTVARLRHKDLAIRILRQHLAATEHGKLGRHTGATLRDTYVVGPLLGTGGMGEVYKGHHRRTQRPVAIKILHPHLVDDETLMRRFRREAEITGRLGSENIVEIIDIDRHDDQPFLVLELLEGEDLAARIGRVGQLPLDMAGDIATQAARGLEVAHAASIVHRDLKPENLFLVPSDGGDVVKILDFGVSKIRGNATAITREVALIGTPVYMSPEQAVGLAEEADARTDIFALGGIIYDMLTGQRPFAAPSVPALLRRICDEEPIPASERRPDLPPGIDDVLAIAMAKDPDERYADVGELAADLRAAIAGELPRAVVQRALGVQRGWPASRANANRAAVESEDTIADTDAAAGDQTIDASGQADTVASKR